MLPGNVIIVPPEVIRFKLSTDLDLGGIQPGDWDITRRVPIERTDKHVSVHQRYAEGRPWVETDLFKQRYTAQFATGEMVKNCQSLDELASKYEREFDVLFNSLKTVGFRGRMNGKTMSFIKVHVARDGAIILGNQGNHRLAMSKILGLSTILARIDTIHPDFQQNEVYPVYEELPRFPECAKNIPAMTTLDERLSYYRLVMENAKNGSVIELGAWLGAATAFIAAGIRDSGVGTRAQIYDRFRWDPSHEKKGATSKDMIGQFEENLGPLLDYVNVNRGELKDFTWDDKPISVVVFDAPKRVREISSTLKALANGIRPGTFLAWQDYAYFPSYDIPACMARIGKHVEFVEGVYPGTLAIFKVLTPWTPEEVSRGSLDLLTWSTNNIITHWEKVGNMLPRQMYARFMCGAIMFLCDNGQTGRAKERLYSLTNMYSEEIVPKWKALYQERPDMVKRYQPLFDLLENIGAM